MEHGDNSKVQLALPVALSRDLERLARRKGKSTAAVLQHLITESKQNRLAQEFKQTQAIGVKKQKRRVSLPLETSSDISRNRESRFRHQYLHLGTIIPGSSAHRAIQLIIDGHDRLLIYKPILDEVLTTLAR